MVRMSAPRLHIVMPCAKPWNLARIAANFFQQQLQHGLEIRWHIMAQGPEPDEKGYKKSNEGSRYATTGYVWYPSDDTLQETFLFRKLHETIEAHPNAKAIVFSEKRGGVCPYTGGAWPIEPGILRAKPENMKPCWVDCSQVFFHHSLTPCFDFEKFGPEADGNFIVDCYRRAPESFVFVPDVFVLWGALDPPAK